MNSFKLKNVLILITILVSMVSLSQATPIISINEIGSNNSLNPNTYATVNDSIWINLTSDEILNSSNLIIQIENTSINYSTFDNLTFYAQYIVSSDLKFKNLEYSILNIQNTTDNLSYNISNSSSLIIDTISPQFLDVVITGDSIIGINGTFDAQLQLVESDSSNGAGTNNGISFSIDGINYVDASFISVANNTAFNDNNIPVLNGVFGELIIDNVTFLDRAGNSITNFIPINTSIIVDSIAPTSISLPITTMQENPNSDRVVSILEAKDIGDQNLTFQIINDLYFYVLNSSVVMLRNLTSPGDYDVEFIVFDSASNNYSQNITITVLEYTNYPPQNIRLSSSNIFENISNGSKVGDILADDFEGDLISFSINSSDFTIIGDELFTNRLFDFENQSSYSIIINATDSQNMSSFTQLTISVINIVENDVPRDMFLTNTIVSENLGANQNIAELIIIDELYDTHSFIVNDSNFLVIRNSLITTSNLSSGNYIINITTFDSVNNSLSKQFIIEVAEDENLNFPPQNIILENTLVNENASQFTLVGEILAQDFEGENITFEVFDLTGNNSFLIASNFLFTNTTFDYNIQSTYPIIIKTTDSSNHSSFELFNIIIIPQNFPPNNFF